MGAVEFNNLLLSNSEFLKPFAVTLARDSEMAKDLFQETLYRALANKEKYNAGTNIRAWLYTIMRNIFINNYRKKNRYNVITGTSSDDLLFINNHAAPVEATIFEKDILVYVHKLPVIFKHPFLLYFNGYRYHEIAHMINEPLGTVKSRIHFARKMLKSQIERY